MNCDEPTALANSGLPSCEDCEHDAPEEMPECLTCHMNSNFKRIGTHELRSCPTCACNEICDDIHKHAVGCEDYVEQTICDKCVGCETGDPDNGGCVKFIPKQKEDRTMSEIVNPQVTDAVTQCNPEKLLTFREVCGDVAKGTPMLYRCGALNNMPGLWKEWSAYDTNIIDMGEYDYRRKPTKKIVAWTIETAPKCGEVVTFNDAEKLITERCEHGLVLGATDVVRLYGDLLDNKRCQFHGKPCGQEVEQ